MADMVSDVTASLWSDKYMKANPDPNDHRGYLRAEGVLKMLPISRRTLMRWQKQGRLPFIRAGKRMTMYRVADIEKMLTKMTVNAI